MRPKYLFAAALAATALASPAPAARSETAVLAGGCFWGMEAVFEHVQGVSNVVSGYAGGDAKSANYRDVSAERTGHAEAVRITYDPSRIGYNDLLAIYFSVAHDPTQVNRQGPDTGPSYRSAIFPQDARQKAIAAEVIARLKKQGVKVATKIESGTFYPAEAYHQDYARKNPNDRYIVINDAPKVKQLKAKYPARFKG
ncbi:peptide-methionine (S)-S-oxide reductase MsrA [Sphingomonas sabuli]|uniref:Peptide methionine sulfoxide reductase MsrA n=2 Tax=Sphingomonas sabuli TaxID=2764186 RepID=A0A7G9L633_9SPHN|nr:peptide-methionine (S)-S-oxide reductase MsrA [Sphingomonas sabuli]